MAKTFNISADGVQVEVRYGGFEGDFISLTDIARYRTAENPGYVIQNWMRNRNTVRFLGLWERFHNSDFITSNSRQLRERRALTVLS